MPSIPRPLAESIAVALGYPDAPQVIMTVIEADNKVTAAIDRASDLMDELADDDQLLSQRISHAQNEY